MGGGRARALAPIPVILLALLISGCGQSREANEHLDAANAHIEAYDDLDAGISERLDSIDGEDTSEEALMSADETLAGIEADLPLQATELDGAKQELEAILALDVGDDYKDYAQLQLDAVDVLERMHSEVASYVADVRSLYDLVVGPDADPDEVAAITSRMEETSATLAGLESEYEELAAQVVAFYDSSDLGG